MALFASIGCGGSSSPSGGGDAAQTLQPNDKCARYLSCVLVATPQSYAAELALYGADSECWRTPQQTTNCGTACDAAFADISSQCDCQGTMCTAHVTCGTDPAEPNDTSQTAFQVPMQSEVSYTNVAICPATDKDFFAVTVAAGQTLTASFGTQGPIATFASSILNSAGSPIAIGSVIPSTSLLRDVAASLPAGTYYVSVSSTAVSGYTLLVDVTGP